MKRFLFAALICACWPALAASIEGRVIEVPDGRTLTILSTEGSSLHRVRLAGIQVPPREQVQGNRARESLRRMARGKTVRVETSGLDSAGLLVGTVLVVTECSRQPCAPLLDPGLTQLSSGFAAIDPSNLAVHSEETQKRYLVAEQHAKAQKIGVWRTSTPAVLRP